MESKVAFVGLGRMGAPMASRLVQAGFDVVGYDVSPEALARVAASGVKGAPSLAAAVSGVETIILVLPDSDAVESVLMSADETLSFPTGSIIVDMSSSDPLRTQRLASILETRGVTMIDAPVSGGVARAETGELAIMVGGGEHLVDRVRDLLGHLGQVFRAGPVGAGHTVKALNNLMMAVHLLATCEAMAIADVVGLDLAVVLSIVNASSGRSASTEHKWPNVILPGKFDSRFVLQLLLKDIRIAVGLAEQTHVPAELSERTLELWTAAAGALPADADHTEVAKWVLAQNESRISQ